MALQRPQKGRVWIAIASWVGYVLVFFPLYMLVDQVANTLVVVPVIVTSWLLGLRGGALAGVLAYPLNLLLFYVVGHPDLPELIRKGGPPMLAMIIVGLVVGRMTDLEERLHARLDERQQLVDDLDAFAHTVAHDIQAPLQVVYGFVDLLLDEDDPLEAADQKKALEQIKRYSLKLSNIVRELLVLARVRQADEVPHERLDTPAIIEEVLARLAGLMSERQPDIDQPDEWPPAYSHGPWVEEVWVNLISNAIKFGGDPPHVTLDGTALPGGGAKFWVRDNGPGISPEHHDRLFVPFAQVGVQKLSGEGLGLSIVRRIVKRLGGEVGVDSAPGLGSTFWFTLPPRGGAVPSFRSGRSRGVS